MFGFGKAKERDFVDDNMAEDTAKKVAEVGKVVENNENSNADFIVNPEGNNESLEGIVRNKANMESSPGANAELTGNQYKINEGKVEVEGIDPGCKMEEAIRQAKEKEEIIEKVIDENMEDPNKKSNLDFTSGIVQGEKYDTTVRERVEYEPSVNVDDGDIYDEAVDVRELHKNDENLIDGWTSENPEERDRRIEEHMEEHGSMLDYEKPEK